MTAHDPTAFFWEVATPLLANGSVSKSTMMGFPCLRVHGDFFASAEPKSGDLIVKLPADRVQALIDGDAGEPFAPNGRRFREWVRVVERDAGQWRDLIDEARGFVAGDA